MTTNSEMPKIVHKALECILEEFGNCDLDPRLEYFAEGDEDDHKCGQELARAFCLVEIWAVRHYGKAPMTAKDFRQARAQADINWKYYLGENEEAA